MHTQENIETIHASLGALEGAFQEFKSNQENKFQQLQTAMRRPVIAGEAKSVSGQDRNVKDAFMNYVCKGIEAPLNFEQKSLTSVNDASGGYLIPHPMVEMIHGTVGRISPMRSLARMTTISTDTLELLLDKGETDVGWVAETADRPETSTPELSKLRISVHQIYAKPRASQKLLDDASFDVEHWLADKIAQKMCRSENHAFINGDGNGKPKGFLTYPTVALGKGEWGKFESISTGEDGALVDSDVLLETCHSLRPEYLAGAVWMMSRSAMAAVRRLRDQSSGDYLWQPGLLAGAPDTLLGYPVVIAEDMPTLVAGVPSQSMAFGNFYQGYQIVDRSGMHILRDPYSAKPYVEFYATKRVGGDVINFDAIKIVRFAKD